MYFYFETKDAPLYAHETKHLEVQPHMHTHIELVYILSGSTVCTADNKTVTAKAGDIFISFPNQIHSYSDIVSPKSYLLIFSPDYCPEFTDRFRSGIPESPVLKGADPDGKIKALISQIVACANDSLPDAKIAVRARVMLLLCALFGKMRLTCEHTFDENLLKKIIAYCYDNYKSDITLHSCADALGISEYYISHIFAGRLHTGFREYINSLRINCACDLLASHKVTVTEAAYESGFTTTRTFNRCFAAALGMTPREYRARHGG